MTRYALTLAAALAAAPAWAAVIHSTLPRGNSGIGSASNDPAPPPRPEQHVADDFELAAPVDVRSLKWNGNYVADEHPAGFTADFELRFYADDGGLPTNSAPHHTEAVTVTALATTIESGDGHSILRYEADLAAPLSLSAGVHWLSIVEVDTDTSVATWEWGAGEGGTVGVARRVPPAVPDWIYLGSRPRAFELRDNVIPEPSALGIALAPAGAGWLRRRR